MTEKLGFHSESRAVIAALKAEAQRTGKGVPTDQPGFHKTLWTAALIIEQAEEAFAINLAWNRRTPAPEGEAWQTVPREPTEAIIEAAERAGAAVAGSDLNTADMTRFVWSAMLAASPVAPAPEREAVKAGDIAQMTCFANNHGTLEDWAAWCRIRASLASPVVPVGSGEVIDREWLIKIIREHSFAQDAADAILAALRPTDTGRE